MIRKRFGQHFLIDQDTIDHILHAAQPRLTDHWVEIGPGRGALTWPLLKRCNSLDAIEIDRNLAHGLQTKAPSTLRIHNQDALAFDFGQFKEPIRVIGNLPYNISTPLLFHLIKFLPHIQDGIVMVQKEVALRMQATYGQKAYGRLSVMLQIYWQMHILLDIPPEVFYPQPKVHSALIQFTPRANPLLIVDPALLADLVRLAFQQRRKTMRNALAFYVPLLHASDFNLNLRAEQWPVETFVHLANFLSAQSFNLDDKSA